MRYMCSHTLPPHAITPDQVRQVSEAAQNDPNIRGYRSFFNLSVGKIFCVLEANDEQAVIAWFKKMNLPYDSVMPLEFEGERGNIREEAGVPAHA